MQVADLKLVGIVLVAFILASCNAPDRTAIPVTESQLVVLPESTADPVISKTLQAGAQSTAEWVMEQTLVPRPTDEPFPTIASVSVEGVAPIERVGPCSELEGFTLHDREGFCLAAPSAWKSLNVDGGLAAFLQTTPGQAISLQPDWAETALECHLMVYISTGSTPGEYLESQYVQFSRRKDLEFLSFVQMQSLGGMALPGYTWIGQDGSTGGLYAALVGANRLAVISQGGTQCPLDDLSPTIETLRFDAE
jgi:hypothetical protein